ncbi:MAG: hypothetical protein PHU44_18495 [Syntrophales bacterium]|nr:hypothetical protein [Syntrophales bacterium]MDD5643535.1 hypothetical protein [Syntrophales bacterium]
MTAKSVIDMDEGEIFEKAKDLGWAVTQILFLKREAKLAQAMINDLALPRIADLEGEVARLKDLTAPKILEVRQ